MPSNLGEGTCRSIVARPAVSLAKRGCRCGIKDSLRQVRGELRALFDALLCGAAGGAIPGGPPRTRGAEGRHHESGGRIFAGRHIASGADSLQLDDLHNSNQLATEAQHRPLSDWFKARQIAATHDLSAVDTTGFFDEAAREIGDHYEALAGLMEQIRFAYRNEFTWLNVDLSNYDPLVRQNVLGFCRELYSHTLFARYSYKQQTKILGLGIQPAKAVRAFFTGGWLEWYALTTLLSLCMEHGHEFSCARGTDDFPAERRDPRAGRCCPGFRANPAGDRVQDRRVPQRNRKVRAAAQAPGHRPHAVHRSATRT